MDGLDLDGIDLCQFPAQVPPDGRMWNFVDPETLQPALIAVGAVMTTLSIFFTGVRIHINFRKFTIADYFAVTGTVLVSGFTLVVLACSKYYRHLWDIPACWLDATYLKFLFTEMLVFGPAVFFTKASIFMMYRQIFHMYTPMHYAVYLGLFVTAGTYLASVAIAAYYGAPRPGQAWEVLLFNGMPLHESVYGIIQGSIAIAIDVYIFILPLPILLRLTMSRQKRVQLVLLFGTALIGVAASVVAITYRVQLLSVDDTTWHQACAYIAVIIENNVAIIVAAMPAFAAFMRRYVAGTRFYYFVRARFVQPWGRRNKPLASSGGSSSVPQVATIGSPGDKGQFPRDIHGTTHIIQSHATVGDNRQDQVSQRDQDMAQHPLGIQRPKHPAAISPV